MKTKDFCLVDMWEHANDRKFIGCDEYMRKIATQLCEVDGMPAIWWVNPNTEENPMRTMGHFEIQDFCDE